MTGYNSKKAAALDKLALEALKEIARHATTPWEDEWCGELADETLTAINALAQPEQEPVAWGVFEGNLHDMFFTQEEAQEMAALKGTHAEVRPLYTAPLATQRPWVGLTADEYAELAEEYGSFPINQIEAKLKEKNNG
jgi:hypothetical protein